MKPVKYGTGRRLLRLRVHGRKDQTTMNQIFYSEPNRQFTLNAGGCTYALSVTDDGYLTHVYFGAALPEADLTYLLRLDQPPFTPEKNQRDAAVFMDTAPFEFPCCGLGDYREHAAEVLDAQGMSCCDFRYESHRMYGGKCGIPAMPAAFAKEDEAETLELTLRDRHLNLTAVLRYTVFRALPVVIRSVSVQNQGGEAVSIRRLLSASVDLPDDRYEMITLHGSWARERSAVRVPLHAGKQRFDSLRGESSHQVNPFLALVRKETTEDSGEAMGMTLIYSGNFMAQAEVNQHSCTRVQMGINPTDFSWLLEPGETFDAPEAVLVWSDSGLGGMSRAFHDLFRSHLIRSPYQNGERPVLLNSWEAAYFDISEARLLELGGAAAELGIELLVMDDGWFGHRNSDNSSLGDWTVNPEKLPHGLKGLCEGLKERGIRFGIWVEPEMISPDSDLYRAHPDWAIQVAGRPLTLCREQYVLDFSREDVRDAIWAQLKAVLESAEIAYVKWDMNRQLTEVGSAVLPVLRQRELWHRYVLGVYALMERLVTEFPHILLETCSGGGARFDAGMLYYGPQIWTSDNTDAVSRLSIQYGTSLCYPPSAMGAHVSVCPNHATGRVTPFSTRSHVAMAGTFGYELDVTKLSEEEKAAIPAQIAAHKRYWHLISSGDLYRLTDPFSQETLYAWMNISKDKGEALLTAVQVRTAANTRTQPLKLRGLDPDGWYQTDDGACYSGAVLMHAGLYLQYGWGDYQSVQLHFTRLSREEAGKES